MRSVSIKDTALTIIAVVVTLCGCSLDPIGELFLSESGPFTEQIGPYLRITFAPGVDRYPSWSSNGDRIVYSASGFEEITQGHRTVNIIPSMGGASRRVSPVWARVDYNYFPCWINGDTQIIFISFGGISFSTPLEPEIMIVNPDDIRDYTSTRLGMNSPLYFSVSPDESAIAYSDYLTSIGYTNGFRDSGGDGYFFQSDTLLSSLTAIWYAELPLTGEPSKIDGTMGATRFSWSPDSNMLAFTRDGYIYTIPALGGSPERQFEGKAPVWSPEGSRIACVIDGNIFIYSYGNGESLQITTEGGNDPAWSPDGGKLAFTWNRNGNFDIYVVDITDVTTP
jgi:Tol biopolymer transport system component